MMFSTPQLFIFRKIRLHFLNRLFNQETDPRAKYEGM